ncbi:MAG: MerR family transcriptional regulator/heat shock protein HspR [Verrucomicrobiales bacterium]|jgi:MerR family transcriptional regulator/heat shock protein HspR
MARRSTAVYVISVAAELSGMHPQTLRIYERKGLVQPARTSGGSRRYSDADVALLQRISDLTSEGMNLVGVKRVLDLERRVTQLERELAKQRSNNEGAVSEAIRETERSHRRDLVPLRQTVTIYESD